MRQVDDAHDAENQRQPAPHQEQERAIGNAVEGLYQPESCIHDALFPSLVPLCAVSLPQLCIERIAEACDGLILPPRLVIVRRPTGSQHPRGFYMASVLFSPITLRGLT